MSGGGPRYEPNENASLDAWVLPPRKEKIEGVLAERTRTLRVVLHQLEDSFNVAAILRTCEAQGIQDVHIVPASGTGAKPNAAVTQGCDKWLSLHFHPTFEACRAALKQAGFCVMGSAIAPASGNVFAMSFAPPLALVFGNERQGLPPSVTSNCDGLFWIPMRGFVQSFNVSAAVSATLALGVAWRLRHLGTHGDLSLEERSHLHQEFLRNSLRQRDRFGFEP